MSVIIVYVLKSPNVSSDLTFILFSKLPCLSLEFIFIVFKLVIFVIKNKKFKLREVIILTGGKSISRLLLEQSKNIRLPLCSILI